MKSSRRWDQFSQKIRLVDKFDIIRSTTALTHFRLDQLINQLAPWAVLLCKLKQKADGAKILVVVGPAAGRWHQVYRGAGRRWEIRTKEETGRAGLNKNESTVQQIVE